MKHAGRLIAMVVVVLCARGLVAEEMFSQSVGPVRVRPVTTVSPLRVPFIIWGGDMATFHANGGLKTKPGTIFQKLGLNLQLEPGDDFHQQVRDYMEGKSPFLRGTYRMIGMASEVIGSDPRTKGVVIMQMTWSAGDHMVGRANIPGHLATDPKTGQRVLKGKKIVLQAGGPHVGLLDDVLGKAGIEWEDVNVVWAKDLTASDDSPAAIFRRDPTVDACFVITPDMIGLTGGIDSNGTGGEGTVRGAHVVASTFKTFQKNIADVYVCRSDFLQDPANKDLVTRFVAGYLEACEAVNKLRDDFESSKPKILGKHPPYKRLLGLSQSIYTKDVMPTLEEDAHGLLLDCTFVNYPGNWEFFNSGAASAVSFEAFNKKALALAAKRGYSKLPRIPPPLSSQIDFDSKHFDSLSDKRKPEFTPSESTVPLWKLLEPPEGTIAPVKFEVFFEPNRKDFFDRKYFEDYKRVVEMLQEAPGYAFRIEGHADHQQTVFELIMAGRNKGILKKVGDTWLLRNKPVGLSSSAEISHLIKQGAFDGDAKYKPKERMQAALALSEQRAENVKQSIVKYAQERGVNLDPGKLVPVGKGISDPAVFKPIDQVEMQLNRRVEFEFLPIQAESTEVIKW